jgi:hypothetical protein
MQIYRFEKLSKPKQDRFKEIHAKTKHSQNSEKRKQRKKLESNQKEMTLYL